MIKIQKILSGNRIAVFAPFEMKDLLSSIPGALWNKPKGIKAWTFPATPYSAFNIVTELGLDSKEILDSSLQGIDSNFSLLLQDYITIVETQNFKREDSEATFDLPWKTFPPYRHQIQGYRFTMPLSACLLWFGMGTGKSRIVVDVIRGRGHKNILIACPKAAVESVWPKQLEMHATYQYLISATMNGGIPKRLDSAKRTMDRAATLGIPGITVINHDAVWRNGFGEFVRNHGFDCLIIDECQVLSGPGSKVSRFFSELALQIPYRIGLSGTAIPHRPPDIYGVFRALDPAIFGTNVAKFRDKFCVMGGYQNHTFMRLREDRREEFVKRVFSITMHVPDSAVDLPSLSDPIDYKFSLPKEARKLYNELKEEFLSEWDGVTITAPNILSRLIKLQQIANGYVPVIEDREDEAPIQKNVDIHDEKIKLLVEIFESIDLEEPVPIFYKFKKDAEAIKRASELVGRTCGELSGSKNDLIEWQEGYLDNIAIQIRSGNSAIDLTRACIFGYYSQDWKLDYIEQSKKRVHRPPQKKPVRWFRILAANTIDMAIIRSHEKGLNDLQGLITEGRDSW